MAHLFQVGAGSGGMLVLDLLARDPRIDRVTLVEPDVYQPHNVARHLFPIAEVGQPKADGARRWLLARRPELPLKVHPSDLLDPLVQAALEEDLAEADVAVCAVDNEPAKYHFDLLMRRHRKPWTLGEVLSGGIGGFVHGFTPGRACYGCAASHLQRSVVVDRSRAPDYSDPASTRVETTVPAPRTAISVIASLHAQVTLQLLQERQLPFTSLLMSLVKVPGIFEEAPRFYHLQVPRSPTCLVCREQTLPEGDLDRALDEALARLNRDADG